MTIQMVNGLYLICMVGLKERRGRGQKLRGGIYREACIHGSGGWQ